MKVPSMRWFAVGCLALTAGCATPIDIPDEELEGGGYDSLDTSYNASSDYEPFVSDVPVAPPPSTAAPQRDRIHVLVKGDTLFGLARQYYGDESRWRDILSANSDQISDANMVYPGQSLRIPE